MKIGQLWQVVSVRAEAWHDVARIETCLVIDLVVAWRIFWLTERSVMEAWRR